ncbi:MAG: hypothetical protein PHQ05_08040 [Sterolibacterium sp.]|nr:hypothetical protein [Sterolibacterium sp.]
MKGIKPKVASKKQQLPVLLAIGFALLLSACASQKIRTETQQKSPTIQVLAINLQQKELRAAGMAFITPSSITGQEEDKQALALAFTGVLQKVRPDLRIVALPETLSSINRKGLTREYRQMFEDYRLTGIFDRETLQKVAEVTGMRYLAQLKLGAFRQESKSRFGFLGVRVVETKTSTIRLFLQIWDSNDGSVAWEGSQESTVSHESLAEEYVSMRSIVEESARDLVAQLP